MKLALLLCSVAVLGTVTWSLDVSQMFELNENDQKDLCVDLVFILDWSCSVALQDFEKMRLFVRQMIDGMKIGPYKSMVGIVTFSDGAEKRIGVEDYKDKDSLINAVDDLFAPCRMPVPKRQQRENGYEMSQCCDWSTETWKALNLVRTDKDLLKSPRQNPNGKSRTRVTLTITDGYPRQRTNETDERGARQSGDSKEIPAEKAAELTAIEGKANIEDGIISLVVKVNNSMKAGGRQSREDNAVAEDVFVSIASDGTENGLQYLFEIADILQDVGAVFRTIARYTCPDFCGKALDIVFIMDKSLSITAHNIEVVKKFFNAIADSLDLDIINLGMLTYNVRPYEVFRLNSYKPVAVDHFISAITTETAMYTETGDALKVARYMLDRYGRPGVPKLGLLACDGITWQKGARSETNAQQSPAKTESKYWKDSGKHIMIIGEPNHKEKRGYPEWELVATPAPNGNVDQHIYDMQTLDPILNFNDLLSITGNLTRAICNLA